MAAKASKFFTYVQFRIVLPLILLIAALLRYNAISLVYLVCLLVTPLLRIPSRTSMKGTTGFFLFVIVLVSLLPVLGHLIFHITLVALATDDEPYGSMFTNCTGIEPLVRQIGFQRLDNAGIANILRLLLPDVIVLITSLITLVMCRRIFKTDHLRRSTAASLGGLMGVRESVASKDMLRLFFQFLQNFLFLACGVIVPSIFNVVYFLVFLSVLTLWGCYKSMGRIFGFIRIILLSYTGSHIILLYLYQFQFFQEALDSSSLVARVLGLTSIVYTDCSNVDALIMKDANWSEYMNFCLLLALFWALAYNIFVWRQRWRALRDSPRESHHSTTVPEDSHPQRMQSQNETGSMVFTGSFNDLDEAGEEELLVGTAGPISSSIHYGASQSQTNIEHRAVEAEGSDNDETSGVDKLEVDVPVKAAESRKSRRKTKASLEDSEPEKVKRKPWMSVIVLIMKQSYVLSLIAMMAWSITFHSWLTFALLLTACILWMMPNSRQACLKSSPFVLVYAQLLLLAGYVFNMNIKDELPQTAGSYLLSELGLQRFSDPPLLLGLQTFYTLFVVLTMRQYLNERHSVDEEQGIRLQPASRERATFLDKIIPKDIQKTTYDSKTMVFLGHFLWILLCKYWIVFCCVMMFVISLQEVVIYKIIYLFLILIFLFIFQINLNLWRAINYVFWWLVIVYSMVVLIVIYTFQFQEFNEYWTTQIGITKKVLEDIGLVKYNTAGLFVNLLTPTSFLVFVILQVRYFHEPFLRLSDPNRFKSKRNETGTVRTDDEIGPHNITEDEEERPVAARPTITNDSRKTPVTWHRWFKTKALSLRSLWAKLTGLLWRIGEIHMFKLVVLITMVTAVEYVSALTAVYVLLLAIFLPMINLHVGLSSVALLWTIIIILAKTVYQLRLVETDYWQTNCSEFTVNGTENDTRQDNAVWFGLEKVEHLGISIADYVKIYLVVLSLICLESIIRYHQRQHYSHPAQSRPPRGILFRGITRANADETVTSCVKFFANYFFYKFGLECCWVMTAITASVRNDAIALLYITIMGILMMLSRRNVVKIWPIYRLFLVILLILQFLVALGFPKGACIVYPWVNDRNIPKSLQNWLFLPDYDNGPLASFLIADFLQLLFVCLQAVVFDIESQRHTVISYGGGDNKDILEDVEANMPIPCEDFTIQPRTNMEHLKSLVFEQMFWVTMAIIFITGTTRINIFSLFYVIGVFCFMWFGKEFFLKPLRSLLSMWNLLIAYCVFVLFFKTALQLVGCVYVTDLVKEGQCWLVQLFGVNCLFQNDVVSPDIERSCPVEKDNSGMAWDVVCLVFLLLQRRIYSSHYFRHVVDTIQAQNSLVSKGADLINRIMVREVKKQNEMEKRVLVNIKEQMMALKKKQANLKKDFVEPEEHFQAIRAGDYYLFEDVDLKSSSPTREPTTLDIGVEQNPSDAQNPLQLINTAQDQSMEAAVASYKSQPEADHHPSTEVEPQKVEDEPAESTSLGKVTVLCNFLITIWYSVVDMIINQCNRLSRNYRLVARKLSADLILEKHKIVISRAQSAEATKLNVTGDPETSAQSYRFDGAAPSDMGKDFFISLDELEKEDDEEMAAKMASNRDRLKRFFTAIFVLMASQSEMMCYIFMILDQMVYGSLLSLPLPLMVFLWGMLSVPRPSKTFWITVITYVEAIVVCKYLFQFGFFPWNDGLYHSSPFYPPRIIGIEKRSQYASLDIALLLVLFMHRSILRKYGLWRDSADIAADMEAAHRKEQSVEILVETDHHEEEKKESHAKSGQGLSYVLGPFTKFFKQVAGSSYNATTDVYAPMFFCDFILFFVLVFGFNSFGPVAATGSGDVATYIQNNKIPVPFLIMLLTQFVFIIVDRALFLRKNVLGKFIFQIFMVILIHIWMFFILPSMTERSFSSNLAAKIWYIVKSIYFGLSAYQIRCGYPTRILGNFLTKSYSLANMILFKGFLAVPFLLELRALMDWMWTDSSLALGNWLQMEDIYANIYVIKCWREFEKAYPQQRAFKKSPIVKYLSGGLLLFAVIFIIWFPLVFFSFFNAVFISNPPKEATLTIGIGGYLPMFKTTALGDSIHVLTDAEFNQLSTMFSKNRNAYGSLSAYSASDVTLVNFDGSSLGTWDITPPSMNALIDDLQDSKAQSSLFLTTEMTFKREPDKKIPSELSGYFEVNLRQPEYKNTRLEFADVIAKFSNNSISVAQMFPPYLRLGSSTKIIVLDDLVAETGKSNISMQLESSGNSDWWDLQEILPSSQKPPFLRSGVSHKISVFTFNDRKAPEALSFLSGYGIIGLYISFVIVIGRLLRVSVTNQYQTIIFREFPDVDRFLQLCLDLYLVREMKEYSLEEDFYAMVLFLYRSPETLIKWTQQTIRIGNLKKKND